MGGWRVPRLEGGQARDRLPPPSHFPGDQLSWEDFPVDLRAPANPVLPQDRSGGQPGDGGLCQAN